MTNRPQQELMTVVEEEVQTANAQNPKLIVQPHSKRNKLGRKIFCCCMSSKSAAGAAKSLANEADAAADLQ